MTDRTDDVPSLDATLALRGSGRLILGRDRIAIIEALDREGSITKAAQSLGISYKTASDAIAAINNLLPRPAATTQVGGAQGGGTVVTDEGRRLIVSFRRLEGRLGQISRALLAEKPDDVPDLLFWSLAMKTSARNLFRAEVVSVARAAVNVEVILSVADDQTIVAIVTNASADDLALKPGRSAIALIKSSSVILTSADDGVRYSTRNRLGGRVAARTDGGVNSEVTLDIGGGKTLTAVITVASANALGLAPGVPARALFKASQVILATD